MTSSKNTKRALLASVLSVALCCAMLIGSTFAWFTDSVSTSVNRIQAGTLKIALVDEEGNSLEGETLGWKAFDNRAQDQIFWEPGATYNTEEFYIKNVGNLNLKFKFLVTGIDGDAKLLEVIDFTAMAEASQFHFNTGAISITPGEGEQFDLLKGYTVETLFYDKQHFDEYVLEPGETAGPITITGHMDKLAGNEYQGLSIDGIAITLIAAQATGDEDSFNGTYDADAEYPVVVSRNELNTSLTLDALKDENGKVSPVEVTLGDTSAEDINYSQNNSGYTGKGVMLGSTKLNKYAATPAAAGEYKFTFKDGTITSAAPGYGSIDNYKDTSVYMLVPGNSDVVFENMTFNGVVSFDIQKYTSPWSNLNSISFKNCTFNGIIIGTCPASNVTFDGCTFKAYTNTTSANNSNPIWWREDTEGSGANANPIKTFTFVNNNVTGTRPVKIERIGKTVSPIFTIKNNTFDISKQAGDTETKNMAINIGMGENPNLPFTLIDEGNTISANTAALYTASLTGGSNWYKPIPGMKVLDGNGNNKVITALVWKTTTDATFELKTVG